MRLTAGVLPVLALATALFDGDRADASRQEAGLLTETVKMTEAASCAGLRTFRLEGGEVTSADWVRDAGTLSEVGAPPGVLGELVPFCRIAAVLTPSVDSVIRVEVWLPSAERWNGRFKGVGSGGLGGPMPYTALAVGLGRGLAIAGTDTGHDDHSPPGVFALGHPEKIIDYGYRAIHLAALIGKTLTSAYYGRPARYAYFEGCSQGGQEALMEAQRYPSDYDGIIAGDPDYNQTHHEVGAHLWVVRTLYSDPRARLTAADAQLVGKTVNAMCDKLDGVEDGVLEDPRRCHVDPGVLQCRGVKREDCLTPPQVNAIRNLWAGPGNLISSSYYPGLERGGEAVLWGGWIASQSADANVHAKLGLPFFRYFVFDDPSWNFRSFDYRNEPEKIDKRFGSALDAVDPNLTAFMDHGGRLIQYHGFNDPDVPPRASIHYYEDVVRSLHRMHVDPRSFYRLFMVPGMGHCNGGPGANSFDMMTALEQWVEQGVAPDSILATKYMDDDPKKGALRTHPLCPYPETARYRGRGSPYEAQNFVCKAPSPR